MHAVASKANARHAALSRSITEAEVARIAADLDGTGFGCLENIVDPAWLARARAQVERLVDANGRCFFAIVRAGDEAGTPAADMVDDPGVAQLLERLSRHARPGDVDLEERVYTVLRVVAGGQVGATTPQLHYDPSTVTVLVPVFVPDNDDGRSGELVMMPNRRGYRRSVIHNILEKMWLQSPWSRAAAARSLRAGGRYNVEQLEPGNIYLFWGYRSYHGNFGCAPDRVRATLLLHYGNPHGDSALLDGIRTIRRLREQRRLGKARTS